MRPEHIEDTATGHVCRHCGGRVDAEGYSEGGMVEDESENIQHEASESAVEEDLEHDYLDMLRQSPRHGPVEHEEFETESPREEESELSRRRRAHYAGILGGR